MEKVNAFLSMLRGLGTMRLAMIGAVGVGVLAFFIYLMTRMASPSMELLYGNLELADANKIVTELQAQKIPYELRREGSEIYVPADKKLDLRVRMAEQNLPGGGATLGYEVFDKADAITSTSFVQNVNMARALEGELARTINSIGNVRQARVHLVLPKREMFSRETQEPSASIVLKMNSNQRLNKQQVAAIQHMVAAAVPKLKPHRISIVDDRGTLLARGYDSKEDFLSETAEEQKLATEQRLSRSVEELLERTLGVGKIRAEVTAEMDFDRVVSTQEIYDPESRVVRSEVTVEEGEQSTDSEGNPVTVSGNLPDAGLNSNSSGSRSSNAANRTQSTVNYEISKTIKNQVKEMGTVRRLSVAVLVDGTYSTSEGTRTYQPRSEQEMDKIASLVRSAIGYDGSRGDQVEVINMQFAVDELANLEPEKIFGMDREFVEKIAANLGLSIVAILFLLLVLKPLVSRAVENMAARDQRGLLTDQSGFGAPALMGPGAVPAPAPGMLPEELEDIDELIDIDKVEGRVKASSIRKIGEIVDKHPDEALSIIRAWMYQDS